jgi:hypothetical protein
VFSAWLVFSLASICKKPPCIKKAAAGVVFIYIGVLHLNLPLIIAINRLDFKPNHLTTESKAYKIVLMFEFFGEQSADPVKFAADSAQYKKHGLDLLGSTATVGVALVLGQEVAEPVLIYSGAVAAGLVALRDLAEATRYGYKMGANLWKSLLNESPKED